MYVYHIGDHSCSVKPDKHKYDEKIKEEIKKNSALPPKKLRMQLIKQKIGEGQFDKAKEVYKARHAHKRLYTVLPKYSKIQVLPGITSCRLVKDNKQAIELNSLLINNMPEG